MLQLYLNTLNNSTEVVLMSEYLFFVHVKEKKYYCLMVSDFKGLIEFGDKS